MPSSNSSAKRYSVRWFCAKLGTGRASARGVGIARGRRGGADQAETEEQGADERPVGTGGKRMGPHRDGPPELWAGEIIDQGTAVHAAKNILAAIAKDKVVLHLGARLEAQPAMAGLSAGRIGANLSGNNTPHANCASPPVSAVERALAASPLGLGASQRCRYGRTRGRVAWVLRQS
jgi:hypothetical protein